MKWFTLDSGCIDFSRILKPWLMKMGTLEQKWGPKNWKRSPWVPGPPNGDPCGHSAPRCYIHLRHAYVLLLQRADYERKSSYSGINVINRYLFAMKYNLTTYLGVCFKDTRPQERWFKKHVRNFPKDKNKEPPMLLEHFFGHQSSPTNGSSVYDKTRPSKTKEIE